MGIGHVCVGMGGHGCYLKRNCRALLWSPPYVQGIAGTSYGQVHDTSCVVYLFTLGLPQVIQGILTCIGIFFFK